MTGVEKIIKHIASAAAAECEKIAESAVIECDRIRAEYAKVRQEEYLKIIHTGKKDVERRLERLTNLAELESKKQILTVQQEMLDAVFALTVNKLIKLPPDAYIAFLAKLACDASLTGEEEILLSAADKKKHGAKVLEAANSALSSSGKKGSLTLSDKTAEIRGGLMLSGNGVLTDCAVETLVSHHRNSLTPYAASNLFD
jgi:V/A-type H+-transporting ATPase subunit E